jgi:hypothetical protein
MAALHMAAHQGRNFGSDLVYTYGPLGFLAVPNLFYRDTGTLAFVTSAGMYVAVLSLIAARLTRTVGVAATASLTLLAATVGLRSLRLPELTEAAALLLSAPLVLGGELTVPLAVGLAALAGFSLLGKLSTGVLVLALVVIAIVCGVAGLGAPRRRPVAGAALAAGVLTFLGLWILARQNLGDLPAYAGNGFQILAGYADAEAIEQAGRGWEYGAALVGSIVAAFAVGKAVRGLPRASLIGAPLLFAVFGYIEFRHGFVRHAGHSLLFFAPAMAAMAALVPRAGLALPLAAAVVFGIGAMSMHDKADIFRLSTSPTVDAVQTLRSGSRGSTAREFARAQARQQFAIPPGILARLRGATVHVDPFNAGVAWAYPEVVWRPAPSFQTITTYTAKLDRDNADFLDSSRAPRFVLRHRSIAMPERRNPRFDSPTWNVRLLCRYRAVAPPGSWLLLERGPDRCGKPVRMSSRHAKFQQRVPVPRAGRDDFVVASFGNIDEPVWQKVAEVLFKREVILVRTASGIDRFIQRTASGLHLMRLPACLERGAIFDRRPYDSVALGRDAGMLARGGGQEAGEYTVTFFRVPFRCPAG